MLPPATKTLAAAIVCEAAEQRRRSWTRNTAFSAVAIALLDEPFLHIHDCRTDRRVAGTRGGKHTAKVNQPPFLAGHVDEAVHPRPIIGTGRDIVAKHIVVAQGLVESRRTETDQYGFTQFGPHFAFARVTRHFDPVINIRR